MSKKGVNTLNNLIVVKRSGQRVSFNGNKIAIAIKQAFDSTLETTDELEVNKIYENVLKNINTNYMERKTINVEDIQDIIEKELIRNKYLIVYKHFKSYRQKRTALRKIFEEKQDHKFARAVEKLKSLTRNNEKCFPIDIINKFGKTISKEYAKAYILENKFMKLLNEGIIEINRIDEYITGKTEGAHLNFSNLKLNNIDEYTNTIIRKVSKYKQEQYGEQTIPSFDYIFVDIFINEFKNILKNNLKKYLNLQGILTLIKFNLIEEKINEIQTIYIDKSYFNEFLENKIIGNIFEFTIEESLNTLKEVAYSSFKKLFTSLEENLKDSNSKLSISLGTNYKFPEAELVRILCLKAIIEIKELEQVSIIYKINVINEEELRIILDIVKRKKNIYMLFEPQKKYYNEELEIFSTGERIYENIIKNDNNSLGRILLSTTSINLVRLGLEFQNQQKSKFYERLTEVLETVKNQLVQRFEMQGNKYKEDYKYLFKDNTIFESNKLEKGQKIRKIIRNGVLNIGLVGLYECASILSNTKVEGQAFEILKFINKKIKEFTVEEKLNFIISETYNEKILEKFISIDKSIYGGDNELNKNRYDNFCKIYETVNDIDIKTKLIKYGKYQKLISSVINIEIPRKQTYNEFKDIIEIIQKSNIIFCKLNMDDK